MSVQVKFFDHPVAGATYYAGLVLWKNAAEIRVMAVHEGDERYIAQAIRVKSPDIWSDTKPVLDALQQVPYGIVRCGLYYTGHYDQALDLVEAIDTIWPCTAIKAAKEDLQEPRPLLWSKFTHKVAKVGLEAGAALIEKTVRNKIEGRDDLLSVALAAEEYDRRLRRSKRLKPAEPTEVRTPHIPARVNELVRKVDALTSLVEKLVAQGEAR